MRELAQRVPQDRTALPQSRNRQELDELETEDENPLLTSEEAEEAATLMQRLDRSVGWCTYGRLSPGHPDPASARTAGTPECHNVASAERKSLIFTPWPNQKMLSLPWYTVGQGGI